MPRELNLTRDQHAALFALAADYDGDIEKLRADLAKGKRATQTKLQPKTATEVVALYESGIITKPEARKYLSLRGAAPVRRPR